MLVSRNHESWKLFKGVEIAVGGSYVDDAAGDYRRGQDRSYGVEFTDANEQVVVEVGGENGFIVRIAVGLRKGGKVPARCFRLKDPDRLSGNEVNGDEFAVLSGDIKRVEIGRASCRERV